jgi:hypothetical protein
VAQDVNDKGFPDVVTDPLIGEKIAHVEEIARMLSVVSGSVLRLEEPERRNF